jgi:3-oxoacyl-[acyl-carrier protein] reductase
VLKGSAGIAKSFAAEGAAGSQYASSKEGADRVVAEITAKGGKAVAVQGDVGNAADLKGVFDAAQKAFGRLDVLVNNAGVFDFHPIEAVTEPEFHRQFNTNVLGPTLATQEALKHFGPQGGSIINVSSVVAFNPVPHSVVFGDEGTLDPITRVLRARPMIHNHCPCGVETEGTAPA